MPPNPEKTIQLPLDVVPSRVSSKQSNFFLFEPKQTKINLFRLFFGLFRETKKLLFRFVSVCFGVSDWYRNNRNKLKKSQKKVLYYGVLETINFFSLFEPKQTETQSVSVVFCFAFSPNHQIFFPVCFDVSDRYWNNRNKQNFWYGELKRLIF